MNRTPRLDRLWLAAVSCAPLSLCIALEAAVVRVGLQGSARTLSEIATGFAGDAIGGLIAWLVLTPCAWGLAPLRSRRLQSVGIFAVYVVLLALVAVGAHAARLIMLPITWPLLSEIPDYFVLRAALADGSVQSALTKLLGVMFAFTCLGAGALYMTARYDAKARRVVPPLAAVVAAAGVAGAVLTGLRATHPSTNPLVTVSASTWRVLRPTSVDARPLKRDGIGFRLETSDAKLPSPLPREILAALSARRAKAPDVLIYVLETGVFRALPLCGFGGGDARLPNLNRLCKGGLFFTRHFSPWSNSTKSNFAIATGVYPAPDARSATRIKPDFRVPSLASALKERGYRTASFASVFEDYDRMDEFLESHGYDLVRGRDSLKLPAPWGNAFGDDMALVERHLEWVNEAQSPALMLLLPSNSHWPGFFPGVRPSNAAARYTGALEYQDQVVGRLLAGLEKLGRLDDTILIVVPDHGASFDLYGAGKNDPAGFSQHHVPMLISHPALRERTEGPIAFQLPSSHVDVAPTVLALLDIPAPCGIQGIDLLGATLPERYVAFYRDFGMPQFFLAQADHALLWDVERDDFAAYALCDNLGVPGACSLPSDLAPLKEAARSVRERQLALTDRLLDPRSSGDPLCRAANELR